MTDEELRDILQKAEEGIKCWVADWDGKSLPHELLYCREKGLVQWQYVVFGAPKGVIKLTEAGTREISRLRVL